MSLSSEDTSHVVGEAAREAATQGRGIDAHEHDFYTAFKRDYPLVWLGTLAMPPILTIVLLVLVYLFAGFGFTRNLVLVAFATFFVFGKFVILGGADPSIPQDVVDPSLTTFDLFLLVLYMDLMTAMLLVFHAGFLYRIPMLGPKMLALAEDGHVMLKLHPWMRRATFIGIVAFVMFPLAATGSVGGAIFGRLLGMGRAATFVGIAIGSVLGCALMYYGAELVHEYLDRDNPLHAIGGIAVLAGVLLLLNYRYRQIKKGIRAAEAAND